MQELKCVHVRVRGKVQGVFFREYTRRKAVELELSGWVKNCKDASVEAEFTGAPDRIEEMLSWLYQGSPHSSVAAVEVNELEPTGEQAGFAIVF